MRADRQAGREPASRQIGSQGLTGRPWLDRARPSVTLGAERLGDEELLRLADASGPYRWEYRKEAERRGLRFWGRERS